MRRFTVERRMRIMTVPIPVAGSPLEVFESMDPGVVLIVLLHKAVASEAAEQLLYYWLVTLMEHYTQSVLGAEAGIKIQV